MIVILSSAEEIGGAEIVLRDYLKYSNLRYTVITNSIMKKFLESDSIKQKIIEVPDFKPLNLSKGFLNGIKRYHLFRRILFDLLRQFNNNVSAIYCNNTIDIPYGTYLAKKINIPLVWHIHDQIQNLSLYTKMYIKFNANYPNVIIFPSKVGEESFLAVVKTKSIKQKAKIVYNGLEDAFFIKPENIKINFDKQKITIGYFGHINTRKNQIFLAEVVKKLSKHDKKHEYKVRFVGKISDKNYYRKLINYCKSNHINFEHVFYERKDLPKVMDSTDIIFLSSNSDPLPTVLIEALARGKLIIAREVGGVPEIVKNGETGFIFPYNSPPEYVAKLITCVLNLDSQVLRNIVFHGWEYARKRFNIAKKTAEIDTIIQNVIDRSIQV